MVYEHSCLPFFFFQMTTIVYLILAHLVSSASTGPTGTYAFEPWFELRIFTFELC